MNYIMENNLLQNDDLHAKILSFVSQSNFEESDDNLSIISKFIYQAKNKWKKSNRTSAVFEKRYKVWLNQTIFDCKKKKIETKTCGMFTLTMCKFIIMCIIYFYYYYNNLIIDIIILYFKVDALRFCLKMRL
ncbi:MAG: hypothetical protein K2P53_03650 [Rickettsiales bacterium]|nr:hypothetical protein [Rickettsiales bacterium]